MFEIFFLSINIYLENKMQIGLASSNRVNTLLESPIVTKHPSKTQTQSLAKRLVSRREIFDIIESNSEQ